ncbi:hypothetical protein KEM48_000522 [Puccinia striiformis f. sp. tritici PST-130]|nr:hypothetical protein KEM48_000522 [Puccinia striiformis f. sp. tritici PST-130]
MWGTLFTIVPCTGNIRHPAAVANPPYDVMVLQGPSSYRLNWDGKFGKPNSIDIVSQRYTLANTPPADGCSIGGVRGITTQICTKMCHPIPTGPKKIACQTKIATYGCKETVIKGATPSCYNCKKTNT